MFDTAVILLIVLFLVGRIFWSRGRKKGREEGNIESHNEGYQAGKETIEDEVRDLAKLPDKEILKRIKNFAKEKERE